MPLSLYSPIVLADIQEIKELGTHGNVWLLKGFDQDKIVVKWEGAEAVTIKSANPAIKAIAPSAKLKILSPEEMNAIDQYILNFEEFAREYQALGMAPSAPEQKAIDNFKDKKRRARNLGNAPFLKMEPVNVMDLAEAYLNRLEGNKGDLRAFTATLNATGGLERLGKIIAVDLFIQNEDRFWPGNGNPTVKPVGVEGATIQTRCLNNVGNVFRIDTGNGVEVGALDFIYHGFDINKPLADCERVGGEWGGRVLADKRRREGFAKDVVHDLEHVLNPRKGRFSLKTKLKPDAASRIASGMVQGAALIRDKLQLKYNPNRWTQGATDRHLILCQVR
ncbi:MAG: hypothetical protein HY820_25005 [Acidobacteria bacterium]|nr:hypothetical protein [Acidobacteriota bacterium]